jgi:hypothetical protein
MKQHWLIMGITLLLAAAAASAAEPVPVSVQAPSPRQILLPPALLQSQSLPAAQPVPTSAQAPPVPPRRNLTLADLKAQFPQSKEGHFQMEVPSILNTSTDREAQVLLDGKSLETTGQVMAETVAGADGTVLRITRSQLLCCSAHARQCSVALKFSGKAPAFKELAWVKLAGTLTYQREGLKTVPVIVVKEIGETAAPVNLLLQ